MGLNHSPKIVTSGLVLALDAADINSYPGSGTSWYDLSGRGNTGTLTNGPTFSSTNRGTIVFDGIDDKVQTSYGPQLGDFTICLWFKDNGSGGYGRIVDKSYTGGFWLGRNGNTANSWGGGILESSSPYGIYLTLTDGQWHFITSIRLGTTHYLYGDGITNTVNNTVSSTTLDSTTIALGDWSNSSVQAFKGDIASCILYNRALSTTEILQNYNATKTRFGL